jgi:hypothetical protein
VLVVYLSNVFRFIGLTTDCTNIDWCRGLVSIGVGVVDDCQMISMPCKIDTVVYAFRGVQVLSLSLFMFFCFLLYTRSKTLIHSTWHAFNDISIDFVHSEVQADKVSEYHHLICCIFRCYWKIADSPLSTSSSTDMKLLYPKLLLEGLVGQGMVHFTHQQTCLISALCGKRYCTCLSVCFLVV